MRYVQIWDDRNRQHLSAPFWIWHFDPYINLIKYRNKDPVSQVNPSILNISSDLNPTWLENPQALQIPYPVFIPSRGRPAKAGWCFLMRPQDGQEKSSWIKDEPWGFAPNGPLSSIIIH
jgi:hypothetical protein